MLDYLIYYSLDFFIFFLFLFAMFAGQSKPSQNNFFFLQEIYQKL